MLSFCDGIRHTYLRGINDVSNDIKIGINSWLTLGNDYIISQNLSNNNIVVESYIDDFLKPYAFDINRISCAALESINDINITASPKFYGWIITKYYYSAFFSAHSILRLTGNGVMNIDLESIKTVRKTAANYGFVYGNLNSGLYCNLINSSNSIVFNKDPLYDDSHAGLWLKFLHYLVFVENSIYSQLPLESAQLIVDKLSELKQAITNWNSTQGNWLSRIRNLTNYSHDFGVWFPYNKFNKEFDNIFKYKTLCNSPALSIDIQNYRGKELLYFVRTCQLINAINFEIQKDLLTRHHSNKSFLLHGIFEYHNKYVRTQTPKINLL